MNARDKLILALDVSDLAEASLLIADLSPYVGYFKIGLELLTASGAPKVIDTIHALGGKIFFDGKFCDIPNTVGKASLALSSKDVDMFNVHASCGRDSMKAAASNRGNSILLAVTVLTSIDEDECEHIFGKFPTEKVKQFAYDALTSGCDGIVCSPNELRVLYNEEPLRRLVKVTPGVRPDWAAIGDQKRIMTPAEAILAGADYLVIGRPITQPPKEIGGPVDAAKKIIEEIESVLQGEKQ